MRVAQQQTGYTLIGVLFGLLGISGAWIYQNMPSVAFGATSFEYQNELQQARQSLISYAVNYMDHYGPQGAGPGHFPCPDTDPPSSETGSGLSQKDNWHLDGPNPPCAKNSVEHGWLPRHVTVNSGRYHFHTRNRQRFLYALSGSHVNNPSNRIVNTQTSGQIEFAARHPANLSNDVIVVVAVPDLSRTSRIETGWWNSLQSTSSILSYTFIRLSDFQSAMQRRVASWLVGTLNDVTAQQCGKLNESSEHPQTQWVASPDCITRTSFEQCELSDAHQVAIWFSSSLERIQCEPDDMTKESLDISVEGVNFRKHWFFRNQWHELVQIHVDNRCYERAADLCRFIHAEQNNGEDNISIALEPITIAETQ